MESIFKRHFWVVHAGFIAVAALLSARTANIYTEAALEPPVELATPALAKSAMPSLSSGPTRLDDAKFGHLFGIARPLRPPAPMRVAVPQRPPRLRTRRSASPASL